MRSGVGVMFAACAIVMACSADGAEIRNVTAKQRYPWNGKVDIMYEVVGNVLEGLPTMHYPVLVVSATDRVAGTSYASTSVALSGDTGTDEGSHHLVWDLKAQDLIFKSEDVVFTVAYIDHLKVRNFLFLFEVFFSIFFRLKNKFDLLFEEDLYFEVNQKILFCIQLCSFLFYQL